MGDWQRKTDVELASDASTGGNGQIAAIEMLRRVKGSNAELRSTMGEVRASTDDLKATLHREEQVIKRLTAWLVGLTLALVLLAVVQLIDMHQLKGMLDDLRATLRGLIGPVG